MSDDSKTRAVKAAAALRVLAQPPGGPLRDAAVEYLIGYVAGLQAIASRNRNVRAWLVDAELGGDMLVRLDDVIARLDGADR